MDFSADHYFRASIERLLQAQHLYRQGNGYYALAMYCLQPFELSSAVRR
jgi:hypothetical protein